VVRDLPQKTKEKAIISAYAVLRLVTISGAVPHLH